MTDNFIENLDDPGISPFPVARQKNILVPSEDKLEQIRRASRNILAKKKLHENSRPSIIADHSAIYKDTTVSEKTLQAYSKRSHQLFLKWLKEQGEDLTTNFEDTDAVKFVRWLISRKPEFKASTWRMYRQSVFVMLMDYKAIDKGNYIDDAIEMIQEDSVVRASNSLSGTKRNNDVSDGKKKENSSSLKYKKFPLNDFKRVIAWLRFKSRSKIGRDLEIWLKAGLLTGLRPSEWKGTDLVIVKDDSTIYGRRAYLHVICAKATNGRGFDVVRTLDLSVMPDDELKLIQEQSDKSVALYEKDAFELHYRECADLLKRCGKTLWPRRKMRYTLYSCRHQAIANWKSSGMSKIEIAVLAGHASHQTAGESYGRKSSGWKGLQYTAHPTKEQLAIALQREQDYIERQYEQKQGSPGRKPTLSLG